LLASIERNLRELAKLSIEGVCDPIKSDSILTKADLERRKFDDIA